MFKSIGLPVPSGPHQVGCVDVMPLCKGDDSGLLFRLYYPTEATPDSAGYRYAAWLPNELYLTLYAKGHEMLAKGQWRKLCMAHPPNLLMTHRTKGCSTLWSTIEDIYSTTSDNVLTWNNRDACSLFCYLL